MEIFVGAQVESSLSNVQENILFFIVLLSGYRPILDAMKTFATDPSLVEKSAVIPDLEVSSLKFKSVWLIILNPTAS